MHLSFSFSVDSSPALAVFLSQGCDLRNGVWSGAGEDGSKGTGGGENGLRGQQLDDDRMDEV